MLIGLNIILEINDDYWHANPKKYKKNDILNFPFKKIKAYKIWNMDKHKFNIAERNGYKIYQIWENDIKIKTIINLIK
jgi:hypothetical protein